MRRPHKIYFWLQLFIFSLLVFILSTAYNSSVMLGLFAVVFFLEIGILEQQNKYTKEEIFYHKSGIFAIFDLLAVMSFLIKFLVLILNNFFTIEFLENKYKLLALIIYTIIRKLYIYKRYHYEK